ncbi:MAG: hypothetical protein JXB44_16775 [Calditrichaceae bacterium]|nr:hypothetical protein [Calditrichaceae bacterium]
MKDIILFLFINLIMCKVNERMNEIDNATDIYCEKCKSLIEVIYPNGEIDQIRPDGITKEIYFDRNLYFKYYAISDSINIDIPINSRGKLYYILAYNTLHNPNLYLAYIKDNYGLWLGINDSINNIEMFNALISDFTIKINNVSEAIEYSMFYLRISNDGGLERLCINTIDDIWLLAQLYNERMSNLKKIKKLTGEFPHQADKSFWLKKVLMNPEEFPDYEKTKKEYTTIIHKPTAVFKYNVFTIEYFTWNQYNGNLEKWEIKFNEVGRIFKAQKKLLSEKIGHFRGSKVSILTFPIK